MSIKVFRRFAAVLCFALALGLLALAFGSPAYALRDPCALDPNNLVYNGSMAQGGAIADGWNTFIFDGPAPGIRWVGNEQIDPNGSVQIYAGNTFDAGIQQTVKNLQPGVYYWVRWGYSLAAKSYDGPNVRVNSIGRKLGIDPTGGTDPHSPNVLWGPDLFDGNAALNRPEMTMTFAARAATATIFLRAMARDGSGGENRVWIDAICMEAKPEVPTATPLAPTATPIPPTATPRPAQPTKAAVAPTKVSVPPTATWTPAPVNSPTPLPPPTRVETPTPIPTARFARPIAGPAPDGWFALDPNLLTGVGVSSIFGSFLMFAFGIVLARR
ncbi:MAG: hypothetical protein HY782_24810 [Chloroflexi bacterium]|nr:hypothetical protein [Chloroflexota bacterium]